MIFRQVRRSCDCYTWMWLTLSVLGITAFICAMFHTDPFIPRVVSVAVCALLLVAVVWCVRAIIHPFEWEVVVDGDQIRWGRADRPDRQQRVTVSQLARLVHDRNDSRVLGDVGRHPLTEIGVGILIRSEDQRALIDCLRQNFPGLKIETW